MSYCTWEEEFIFGVFYGLDGCNVDLILEWTDILIENKNWIVVKVLRFPIL